MFQPILQWFNKHEPAVQAAIIISIVSIITVSLGFIIKDLLIPIFLENRKRRIERLSVFKNYHLPLLNSANSLKARLDEFFRTRSHLLWKDYPKSDFYKYKTISTNYRLCSLLGWIYAFRVEESYLQVPSKRLIKTLNGQLEAFKTSLADGQGVEMDVAKKMLKKFKIDVSQLQTGNLEKFSIEIDRLVQKAITPNKHYIVSDCCNEEQEEFLRELSRVTNQLLPKAFTWEELRNLGAIEIASIRLALIYRDWQNAVGDMMIKINEGTGRRFDVISYREFEDLTEGTDVHKQKWLDRTARLFQDLDVSKNSDSDSRIDQLRKINLALDRLITALKK